MSGISNLKKEPPLRFLDILLITSGDNEVNFFFIDVLYIAKKVKAAKERTAQSTKAAKTPQNDVRSFLEVPIQDITRDPLVDGIYNSLYDLYNAGD